MPNATIERFIRRQRQWQRHCRYWLLDTTCYHRYSTQLFPFTVHSESILFFPSDFVRSATHIYRNYDKRTGWDMQIQEFQEWELILLEKLGADARAQILNLDNLDPPPSQRKSIFSDMQNQNVRIIVYKQTNETFSDLILIVTYRVVFANIPFMHMWVEMWAYIRERFQNSFQYQ